MREQIERLQAKRDAQNLRKQLALKLKKRLANAEAGLRRNRKKEVKSAAILRIRLAKAEDALLRKQQEMISGAKFRQQKAEEEANRLRKELETENARVDKEEAAKLAFADLENNKKLRE